MSTRKRAGSESGEPAAKKARVSGSKLSYQRSAWRRACRPLEFLHESVVATGELVFAIIGFVLCTMLDDMSRFASVAGNETNHLEDRKIAGAWCLVACRRLSHQMVQLSEISKIWRLACTNYTMPHTCGFYMRPDIRPGQLQAFLQGWKPQITRNQVIVRVYNGMTTLAPLQDVFHWCFDHGAKVLLEIPGDWCSFTRYFDVDFAFLGKRAYDNGDYATAHNYWVEASNSYYEQFSHLLWRMLAGTENEITHWFSNHNSTTINMGMYASCALKWQRDYEQSVGPVIGPGLKMESGTFRDLYSYNLPSSLESRGFVPIVKKVIDLTDS